MAASCVGGIDGPLRKWTNVLKGWQYRWFVLDDNAGLLSYYTSKENMARGARRGCMLLQGAVVGINDDDGSTFTIRVDHKTFLFQGSIVVWMLAMVPSLVRQPRPWSLMSSSSPNILQWVTPPPMMASLLIGLHSARSRTHTSKTLCTSSACRRQGH
ncbi:hypothetical protein MTO96_039131 [Rhipicephalus appendiculatus]